MLPYTWTLAPGSGPLPGGLNLTTDGQITGTPNQSGEFYFRVRLADAAQASVERLLRLIVNDVSAPLDITTKILQDGTVSVPYASRCRPAVERHLTTGHMALGSAPLPQDLGLGENTGQISGTPGVSGNFQFIIHAQDSATITGTDEQMLSLTIQQASRASVGMAQIGADGKFQFRIDGTQGVTYAVEMSTDLQTWTPLRSTNAPGSSFIFVAEPPAGARGYFRVHNGQ